MALRRLRSDYKRFRGTILCVAPLTIPDNLNRSTASGEDRLRWLEALPAAVEELTDRWSLTVGEPYSPGGTCAWVAPVRNRAGDGLVLKLAWAHEESAHEADGLRLWNGDGAVRLYESHQLGDTVALLLERCVPGHQLAVVVPEPEQDPIVTGLLARLWVEPAMPHPFRPLELMCEQWATSLRARVRAPRRQRAVRTCPRPQRGRSRPRGRGNRAAPDASPHRAPAGAAVHRPPRGEHPRG